MTTYRFINGPWENSELPTIVKDDPAGGDPHILATIKRVHNPDGLYELCRRADLVEPLVEALRVAIDTLALTEREKIEDPRYGEYIRSIGDKIGYGALMCGAQAEWRKRLREDGDPVGGEFVAGPCYVTVLDTLKTLRAALQAYEAVQ